MFVDNMVNIGAVNDLPDWSDDGDLVTYKQWEFFTPGPQGYPSWCPDLSCVRAAVAATRGVALGRC